MAVLPKSNSLYFTTGGHGQLLICGDFCKQEKLTKTLCISPRPSASHWDLRFYFVSPKPCAGQVDMLLQKCP